MSTFKPGDRITALIGDDCYGPHEETGIVTGPYNGKDGHGRHNGEDVVAFTTDGGLDVWAFERNARLVKPVRPLIGPDPKVARPVFVAPFEYRAGAGIIDDASGAPVLRLCPTADRIDGLTADLMDDFGRYVAETLTARALGEDAA